MKPTRLKLPSLITVAAVAGLCSVAACSTPPPTPPPGTTINGTDAGAPADNGLIRRQGTDEDLIAIACPPVRCVAMAMNSLMRTQGQQWQYEFSLEQAVDMIWDGGQFVAVDAFGAAATSKDGLQFALHGMPLGDIQPVAKKLAYSGSLYVAVSPRGLIATSGDLFTWTPRQSGTADDLTAAIWTGRQFVAVGSRGTILTSPNGIDWTTRMPGQGKALSAVTWSGSQLVAVGDTSFVSSDGVTWQQGQASLLASAVTWVKSLGLFVAVSGTNISTSSDGLSWTTKSLDFVNHNGLTAITWGGDRLVAVGGQGLLLESPDAVNWKFSSVGNDFNKVVWARDRFFALGSNMTWSSPDGQEWTALAIGQYPWAGVAASPDRFVMASEGNLDWSIDGVNWTHVVQTGLGSAFGGGARAIVWTGTKFVALWGDNSTFRSPDGQNWTPGLIMKGSHSWNDMVWTGTQLVAVGDSGSVATSADGGTWSVGNTGSHSSLVSLAWSGKSLVGVGQTTVLSSPDGITWTPFTTSTNVNSVAWAGDRFFATGDIDTVLQSTDGLRWTTFPVFKTLRTLKGLVASNDNLVIVGQAGLIMTYPKNKATMSFEPPADPSMP
ncbi:MAG TPA: hypothetical protein VGL59_00370 [Polyangia bacterium]